jgi:hypothetical protein
MAGYRSITIILDMVFSFAHVAAACYNTTQRILNLCAIKVMCSYSDTGLSSKRIDCCFNPPEGESQVNIILNLMPTFKKTNFGVFMFREIIYGYSASEK